MQYTQEALNEHCARNPNETARPPTKPHTRQALKIKAHNTTEPDTPRGTQH